MSENLIEMFADMNEDERRQHRERLRDEFAMAALPVVMQFLGNSYAPFRYADEAYKVADAMLNAREKK